MKVKIKKYFLNTSFPLREFFNRVTEHGAGHRAVIFLQKFFSAPAPRFPEIYRLRKI